MIEFLIAYLLLLNVVCFKRRHFTLRVNLVTLSEKIRTPRIIWHVLNVHIKTKDESELEKRFLKKANTQSHVLLGSIWQYCVKLGFPNYKHCLFFSLSIPSTNFQSLFFPSLHWLIFLSGLLWFETKKTIENYISN